MLYGTPATHEADAAHGYAGTLLSDPLKFSRDLDKAPGLGVVVPHSANTSDAAGGGYRVQGGGNPGGVPAGNPVVGTQFRYGNTDPAGRTFKAFGRAATFQPTAQGSRVSVGQARLSPISPLTADPFGSGLSGLDDLGGFWRDFGHWWAQRFHIRRHTSPPPAPVPSPSYPPGPGVRPSGLSGMEGVDGFFGSVGSFFKRAVTPPKTITFKTVWTQTVRPIVKVATAPITFAPAALSPQIANALGYSPTERKVAMGVTAATAAVVIGAGTAQYLAAPAAPAGSALAPTATLPYGSPLSLTGGSVSSFASPAFAAPTLAPSAAVASFMAPAAGSTLVSTLGNSLVTVGTLALLSKMGGGQGAQMGPLDLPGGSSAYPMPPVSTPQPGVVFQPSSGGSGGGSVDQAAEAITAGPVPWVAVGLAGAALALFLNKEKKRGSR